MYVAFSELAKKKKKKRSEFGTSLSHTVNQLKRKGEKNSKKPPTPTAGTVCEYLCRKSDI